MTCSIFYEDYFEYISRDVLDDLNQYKKIVHAGIQLFSF
jgi:hypothetical protein